MAFACIVIGLLLAVSQADGHSQQRKRIARPRRELILQEGPTDEQIWDSGLLEKTVSAATLYEKGQQYFHQTHVKRFSGPVLGYVTPWHKLGYERAVRYRAKLTHVAPVWYQLKRNDQDWVLEGGHEYNNTWIEEVRQPVANEQGEQAVTKVVPRVIIELTTTQDHVDLVSNPLTAIQLIVDEVKNKDLDGIVLEVWMTWAHMNAINNEQFFKAAVVFIVQLSQQLRSLSGRPRQLIMAVPPPVPQGYSKPFISVRHMDLFAKYVDFWSLMTYDYSIQAGAQPNSPISWLTLQHKVLFESEEFQPSFAANQALMGVNFYGYDYPLSNQGHGQEAIIAQGVLEILSKQQPPLEWDSEHAEHHFDYQAADGLHRVYYPTPRALELRLEQFSTWGMGVSIWELGQGLERFFDLL